MGMCPLLLRRFIGPSKATHGAGNGTTGKAIRRGYFVAWLIQHSLLLTGVKGNCGEFPMAYGVYLRGGTILVGASFQDSGHCFEGTHKVRVLLFNSLPTCTYLD